MFIFILLPRCWDTVALPRLPRWSLIPVITAGLTFPSRPIPTYLVTECVYRRIPDVFIQIIAELYRYQTRLPLKYGRFLSPPRPLARLLVTEQAHCKISCHFLFPSRPLPRCPLTKQVHRQVNAIVHSRPDQYRGGSSPNKFIIKKASDFHHRPDQNDCRRISALIVITPPYYRDTVALPRISSFVLERCRITAFNVDCRHYRAVFRFPPDQYRGRTSLPSSSRRFPSPSRPLQRCIVTTQV